MAGAGCPDRRHPVAMGRIRVGSEPWRKAATARADEYGGVLSRRVLRSLGVGRGRVASEVAHRRWQTHGEQTVAVHTGPLDEVARRWRAVWEVGQDIAVVDGVTALEAAGLRHYNDDRVHVSVLHTHSVTPVDGVVIHKVRRRDELDVVPVGLPRTRPAAAAIRAAHWAASDRQAALILAMTMQQRLTRPDDLRDARRRVRGRNRRALITLLVADVCDGAHSLGELDFGGLCRAYGLPLPTRQSRRRVGAGRAYLDCEWEEARLVVEIDGSGHRWGLAVSADNLRQNAVAMGDRLVLRIDLLGMRVHEREFMEQVRTAYLSRAGRAHQRVEVLPRASGQR